MLTDRSSIAKERFSPVNFLGYLFSRKLRRGVSGTYYRPTTLVNIVTEYTEDQRNNISRQVNVFSKEPAY
jgi:hypothetical protein